MTQRNMSQIDSFPKSQPSDKYLPPKEKISKEWLSYPPQRYSGDTLNNNIHGNGFYFIHKENKLFYDGLFYANKLEGYSQIFYGDGSHFQGLFKDHKRLGPGILTYPNGEQDVGLWNSLSLARLEVVVEPNAIPMLGNSATGKVKLVKYRYLVPVCPRNENIAADVLNELGANENVLDNAYKLYNIEVENKNNLFFNKRIFDKQFYTTQDCLIDILVPEEEKEEGETKVKHGNEEEDECVKGSSTDTGRIHQISDELELIECKLKSIKKVKYIVEKKVQYCRLCCYGAQEEECVSPTVYEEQSIDQQDTDAQGIAHRGISQQVIDQQVSGEESISHYELMDYEQRNHEEYIHRDPGSLKGDVISKIEDYLLTYCDCHEAMDIDDLGILEKHLGLIKRDVTFYETIKRNLQEKLKYHLKKSEQCANMKTKQVLVNDLLAWNNEELSMCMLKHSFLHRRSEYMVTFNVSSLLKGKRDDFSTPGIHERNCVEFLTNCTNGDIKRLLDTIRINKINVNMCDARGNSGIFFAASNGRVDVIPILTNFGANLDQINDEGLTALLVCLLIYLALHNDRFDWESSFLPEFNPPLEAQTELPKWYQNKSLLSLDNPSIKEPSQEMLLPPACGNRLLRMRIRKTNSQMAIKEPYLFDTSFKDYKDPKKSKAKLGKKVPVEEPPPSPEMELKEEGKWLARNSINRLLNYGADPNIGEVPLPPLLLAVFSEDASLVKSILAARAEVDITMADSMTSLHIIASLRCAEGNINICKTLLEFGGDANLKTSTDHWPERKLMVLGNNIKAGEYEDQGKNPLHILCLRKDFPTDDCDYFSSLATMLINHQNNPNDIYLGHTALSLAVLTGNLKVVEVLLKLRPVPIDPHLVLSDNMGNVLTLYILKRYNNVLPLEKSKEMLKLLVDLGANPLRPIEDFENAIEFMEKEHEVVKVGKGKKKGGKQDKSLKSSKKSSKSSKKGKLSPQEVLKEYLKELARDTIIKYMQLEAVEHLYNLLEANMMDCTFAKILAEYLTPAIALEILATLFNTGRIKYARFDKDICVRVLEYVEKYQKVIKAKKGKKDKKKKKEKRKKGKGSSSKSSASQETALEPPPPTYSELIDATNFEKHRKDHSKIRLKRPGLDDISNYVVCIHCLRRSNKLLLLCPRCQYVYYCSEQCNKLNIKMKAQHTCNMNFYKVQKQRSEAGDLSPFAESLHVIGKVALQKCEKMLARRQEEELERQRKQLEEENKLDIYGTRFLKNRGQERKRRSLRSYMPSTATSVAASLCFTETAGYGSTPMAKKLVGMSVKEKYVDMMNMRHESSLKELTAIEDVMKPGPKRKTKKKPYCKCVFEKVAGESSKPIGEAEASAPKNAKNEGVVKAFEATNVITEPDHIIRKLRKIPSKYQYFIELLSSYFPDTDLSHLFLPYACYCNGHLYYKFLDENIFSKTYSMV